jgi:hypothetical protein
MFCSIYSEQTECRKEEPKSEAPCSVRAESTKNASTHYSFSSFSLLFQWIVRTGPKSREYQFSHAEEQQLKAFFKRG